MIPNQPKFVVHYWAYRHTPTVANLINAPQIVETWGWRSVGPTLTQAQFLDFPGLPTANSEGQPLTRHINQSTIYHNWDAHSCGMIILPQQLVQQHGFESHFMPGMIPSCLLAWKEMVASHGFWHHPWDAGGGSTFHDVAHILEEVLARTSAGLSG